MNSEEMNIDYEKLRKALFAKPLILGTVLGTHVEVKDCSDVYDATPEQLLALAKRRGINLEKYKIK